jgi:hypothetical protein
MVIVSWLISPAQIVLELKLLLTEGVRGAITFNVALAGVVLEIVVPAPVEDNSPASMVLMRLPATDAVTLIDTLHVPGAAPTWAGTLPPAKDRDVDPATAVTVPPQEFVIPAGLAMVRPGWTPTKLSVHEALVSSNAFGL